MIYYIISIAVVSSCCEVAFGIKEYKCKWVLAGIWDLLVAADAFCTFWFLSKKIITYANMCTNVKEAICNVCSTKL